MLLHRGGGAPLAPNTATTTTTSPQPSSQQQQQQPLTSTRGARTRGHHVRVSREAHQGACRAPPRPHVVNWGPRATHALTREPQWAQGLRQQVQTACIGGRDRRPRNEGHRQLQDADTVTAGSRCHRRCWLVLQALVLLAVGSQLLRPGSALLRCNCPGEP